jgi:predicted Ser/Thr protein kinase
MLPDHLGPYRILGKLGRGGMGLVFQGTDEAANYTAAIKLLSGDMAHNADFRERFKAEIDILRKLNHPNIVQIFGYGEQDGQIFYAMEYVSGGSLETQLSNGRTFTWREVAQFGIEMAQALRHAHDRGVIHRDIKPGNLLLTEDGTLKLSDFGIARLFWKARLTGAGNVLGTAEFMGPEQAEGRNVDQRTDLYSLGAVLYVLLARRRLFDARSLMEMIAQQRTEKPAPLRNAAPEVPTEFAQIIHRLLEKDPDRRFATATVLQRRLESMMEPFNGSSKAETGPVLVDPAPVGPPPYADPPQLDPLAATIDATHYAPVHAPEGAGPPEPPLEDEAVRSPADMSEDRAAAGADAPGRFVSVRSGELDEKPEERRETPWISPQTWALACGLLALGLLAYYMLQPASADTLYRRVQSETAGGSIEALEQAEEDIRQFLKHFPGDPRGRELDEYVERIETSRLEKQLELQAKGMKMQSTLSPVQRCYIDAMHKASVDIDVGIEKFRAMADLFGSRQDNSPADWRCILLAKRRVDELGKKSEVLHKEDLTAARACLDRADELAKSDPARAAAIRRGAIELFGDKPWAIGLVQRASAGLKKP